MMKIMPVVSAAMISASSASVCAQVVPAPSPPIPSPAPAPMPAPVLSPSSMGLALIQSSLPSTSKEFATPPGWQTISQGWAALAASSQTRTYEEMAAVANLFYPQARFSFDGNDKETVPRSSPQGSVIESFNDRVGERVAVATCDGPQRVIYYSAEELTKFDPRVVLFVKEHEMSHHRLGQVDCSGLTPKFQGYDEKLADCAAIEFLRPQGVKARDTIMSTASVLYFVNKPRIDPHPAMRERAAYLQAGCGSPLPGG